VSPSEEYLSVVDETDQVVGREARSRIHALKLRHRAVHVLIFSPEGELFLQKRSMLKECNPGKWDTSAAGHVDAGETYDQCAVREVEEEVGVRLGKVPQRLYKIAAGPQTGNEFVWVYRCTVNQALNLNRDEIDEGRWISIERLQAWFEVEPEAFSGAFRVIGPRLWERTP